MISIFLLHSQVSVLFEMVWQTWSPYLDSLPTQGSMEQWCCALLQLKTVHQLQIKVSLLQVNVLYTFSNIHNLFLHRLFPSPFQSMILHMYCDCILSTTSTVALCSQMFSIVSISPMYSCLQSMYGTSYTTSISHHVTRVLASSLEPVSVSSIGFCMT